jgi:hypothetical protein
MTNIFYIIIMFKLTSPSLSIYSIHLASLFSILVRFMVLTIFIIIYSNFVLFAAGLSPEWLFSFKWFVFFVPFLLISLLYEQLKVYVPYSVLSYNIRRKKEFFSFGVVELKSLLFINDCYKNL